MFYIREITLFCLEKRLSKHKMTICSKNVGGMATLPPLAAPMALGRLTVAIPLGNKPCLCPQHHSCPQQEESIFALHLLP